MTNFDFMIEIRSEADRDIYTDFAGTTFIEYTEYFDQGGSQTHEIEIPIEDLRILLATAEAQEAKFIAFSKQEERK